MGEAILYLIIIAVVASALAFVVYKTAGPSRASRQDQDGEGTR